MVGGTSRKEEATRLWNEAYRCQMEGDLQKAIDLYTESIETFPTAEAYTFRGWIFSSVGDLERAITECKRAIDTDPEFGNPYNDIGAYLIQRGELDEAIPWLEKAKLASRYEPKHFPHLNLGRIYLAQGKVDQALEEFAAALEFQPEDAMATEAVASLRTRLN